MFNYLLMFILGIDEAGRGSLMGNLFIVGVLIKNNKILEILKEKKVRDSKKLSKSKREELFNFFNNFDGIISFIEEISPKEIDSKNLNNLEAEKMAKIIERFVEHNKKFYNNENLIIYIDLPERKDKFLKRLYYYLSSTTKDLIKKGKIKLVLEHKADEKYLVVSLASIFAKYLRDKHIDELKKVLCDFGSGYPGDKLTIENIDLILEKEKEKKIQVLRKKWKTLRNRSYYKITDFFK